MTWKLLPLSYVQEEKLHLVNAELCSKLQALEHELGWLTCESEQRQEQHEHELEQKVIEFQQRQEQYEMEAELCQLSCCRGTHQMGADGTKDTSAQSIGLKASNCQFYHL